jgi:hypothetical protein
LTRRIVTLSPAGRHVKANIYVKASRIDISRHSFRARGGTGLSLRQNALDLGFHGVPAGLAHPERDADGTGVIKGGVQAVRP